MRRAILSALRYAGETAVAAVRRLPSPSASDFPDWPDVPPHTPYFMDRTANLRNSVGYVVVLDGFIEESGGFNLRSGGEEGAREGRRFAESLAAQYPTGAALIVVAGMEYASYVSAKGYDVLDSARLAGEEAAERLLDKIRDKYAKDS